MASEISLPEDTSLAQDVIRCSLCENAVEYHCNFCTVGLCSGCTSIHLSDKSKLHQVEEFASRKTSDIIHQCSLHEKNKCELICRDCKLPICAKCVVSVHRQHSLTEMDGFLYEKRKEIFGEINDIEKNLLPRIHRQRSTVDEAQYEDATEMVFDKEEEICSAVRNFGSKLREKITQHKLENQEKGNKIKFTGESILKSIEETKAIIESNDSKAILQFNSIKLPKDSLEPIDECTPQLETKCLNEEDIASLFGQLVFKSFKDAKNVENKAVDLRGSVEEETWFHGFIPREEAELLLQKDGDFLVRESDDSGEHCFVVSSIREEHVHAIITPEHIINNVGPKGTIVEFMKHLRLSSTNLLHPISRQESQLDYDKITVGSCLEETQLPKGVVLCQGKYSSTSVLIELDDRDGYGVFNNLRLLRKFKHQNIVHLIGFSALRKPVLLVMENISEGSLLSYLRRNRTTISMKKRVEMCRDVASGMSYLQQNKCIHRDLAARNCLVGDKSVVKISDFRMSREEEEYTVSDGLKQIPIKWTAPEAMLYRKYTSLCDVWSFGILMWEIFSSGMTPYAGMTNNQAREQIDRGYRMLAPEGTPDACYDLMMKCWEYNPSERYHFERIHKELQSILKSL